MTSVSFRNVKYTLAKKVRTGPGLARSTALQRAEAAVAGMRDELLAELEIQIAAAEAADILYILGMDNGAYEIEHMVRAIDVLKSMDNWQERVRAIVSRVPNMTDEVKRRYEAQLECPVFLIPNEYLLMSLAANNASMIKNLDKSSALSVQIKLLPKSIIA